MITHIQIHVTIIILLNIKFYKSGLHLSVYCTNGCLKTQPCVMWYIAIIMSFFLNYMYFNSESILPVLLIECGQNIFFMKSVWVIIIIKNTSNCVCVFCFRVIFHTKWYSLPDRFWVLWLVMRASNSFNKFQSWIIPNLIWIRNSYHLKIIKNDIWKILVPIISLSRKKFKLTGVTQIFCGTH